MNIRADDHSVMDLGVISKLISQRDLYFIIKNALYERYLPRTVR